MHLIYIAKYPNHPLYFDSYIDADYNFGSVVEYMMDKFPNGNFLNVDLNAIKFDGL